MQQNQRSQSERRNSCKIFQTWKCEYVANVLHEGESKCFNSSISHVFVKVVLGRLHKKSWDLNREWNL